jgi:hypothetical protein
MGARFENRRISVSVAETGADPQLLVVEPETERDLETLHVTDLAYSPTQHVAYVGTCCEPGSGHLLKVDTMAPQRGLKQDDQGFAVDVGGPLLLFARTDTWGTFAVRTSSSAKPDLREGAGIADVAVDEGQMTRVIGLIDSKRLRSLIPTAPRPADTLNDPGILVRQQKAPGKWADTAYPLSDDHTYCRVVPLAGGDVGLLVGTAEPRNPWRCTGDTMVVYDLGRKQTRTDVLALPNRVQHLSIDESSTFVIFTTVEGAVGWRTLDGRGGTLAESGFVAADW